MNWKEITDGGEGPDSAAKKVYQAAFRAGSVGGVKWKTVLIIVVAVPVGLVVLFSLMMGSGIIMHALMGNHRGEMTREEFGAAVIGRTPEQVIDKLGRPDFTGHYSNGVQFFRYENRVIDPVSGHLDVVAIVEFEDGRGLYKSP